MYEKFYGLKEKPFNILPDPDYLFMSRGHENAYTHLEYAIMENKGFVIVTGEIGSGKTTLINYLINKIQQNVQIGLINQTYATPTQFIKMICQDFELNVEGMDKAEMVNIFHEFLLRQFTLKERVILIIDESQNLSPKAMEELRMLSNLEAEKHHLIQMILVGQPELRQKIQRPDLIQFAQRVTVNCHLNGLNRDEVVSYIKYRLNVAGADNVNLFNGKAVDRIFQYSRGIPRLINVICDAALVYGFADELKDIDSAIVEMVAKERKDSGLFTNKTQKTEAPVKPGTTFSIPGNAPMHDFYGDLERRIRMLENRLDNFDQRLSFIQKNKETRDTVVIELFKMLKDSMEKRIQTLVKIREIRK
jgi:general secretion pathway protein A